MYSDYQEFLAHEFCTAIKKLANSEDNLNNFESYLTYHFSDWMEKYANDPESITDEMKQFASIEF